MKYFTYFTLLMEVVLFMGCMQGTNVERQASVVQGKLVQVPSQISGKLLEVRVNIGDVVKKNSLIAVIDTSHLISQRRQLRLKFRTTEKQLKRALTQLTQLQQKKLHLIEKQPLATRFKNNSASQQQLLQKMMYRLKKNQAALKAAAQQHRNILKSRRRLLIQLDAIQKKLQKSRIYAPIEGTISKQYFEPGETLFPMRPLVEIINTKTVDLKIYLSKQQISRIEYGQRMHIRVTGSKKLLEGQVVWISPRADLRSISIMDSQTDTLPRYAVKLSLLNFAGLLKHGMPAEVYLNECKATF